MEKILFIFITHQNNIQNTQNRVKNMMNNLNNSNYVIVQGGYDTNTYDINSKILSINCNDKYEGLPEKVLKSYKYIIENKLFDQYSHFIKLDDDMIIKKNINYNLIKNLDYGGIISNIIGDRKWHIGKCSKKSVWNITPYNGIYIPWCLGGSGYIISKKAISLIKNDINYNSEIFEDLYIAKLLKKNNILPKNINTKILFISPVHQ